MTNTVKLDPVAEILGAVGGRRVLARGDDGRWYLAIGEPAEGGAMKLLSRGVDMDLAVKTAMGVLAGEQKALTWPQSLTVLAVMVAAVAWVVAPPTGPEAPADPPAPPAGG